MAIPVTITCAAFHALQLGHTEKLIRTDKGYKATNPFTGDIRTWICSKIEDNMPLTSMEACNIEDVGREAVFCRYIVNLPIEQEVFIHFEFKRCGVEINFLLWGEDDPERDGDPVRTWKFQSSDDGTTFGMAEMHLRNMLGSRSHEEIMNLYK